MRNQFRNNKVELRIPRLPHPLLAVQTAQALASGSQPPPTPAAPHIAPLPEGFELDPPATSQLHQPASARGQAPKRPAPETPASTASEGPPSGPLSPAHPSQSSTRSSDPPLTAYSGPSRTPVGAHPYQRASPPAGKGKGPDSGKGKGSGPSYADIANKGKKGQKGQKGLKGQKGPNPKGNEGQKGQKGEYAGPILEGGKGPAKGDSTSLYTSHSLLPPFADPFHRLLPPFPIFLLHARSLPSANRTQSVISAHSVLCSFLLISPGCPPWLLPFSSPRPSRSFRPTRSTACFLSLSPASVQLGLSRSFRPTQYLADSVLVFTSLFSASPPLPRLSRSFRPTRSLATSSRFLAYALLPFSP